MCKVKYDRWKVYHPCTPIVSMSLTQHDSNLHFQSINLNSISYIPFIYTLVYDSKPIIEDNS